MPWWQKSIFSSSTKSSSTTATSPQPPPPPPPNRILKLIRRSHPRLTRARRLRHLSDIDVGRYPYSLNYNLYEDNSNSPFSSPVSTTNGGDPLGIGLSPPPPLPLPLPEVGLLNRVSSCPRSRRFPLPSPKYDEDNTNSYDNDIPASIETTDASIHRRSTYQIIHRKTENVDTQCTNSPIYCGKRLHPDLNGARLSASAMSAPTSGFSSPVLSPRRMSPGDCLPPYVSSQGLVACSDPEIPTMDRRTGLSRQASPEIPVASPEPAPFLSLGLHHKTLSGGASPLQHKLSPESSTAWHDSNGNVTVHPLPLPPGAAISSQTALAQQTTAKPEPSQMKSQWQKGKLIGRGTFGSVYVATNRETGALCAMKEVDLIPDDPKSAECIKQLEQEIKVLSQLKHPNIVQYYGSEIVEDHFYIYLEYVHPGSINKYVREHCGAMTESVVRSFTRHILHGLAYLHSTKTIHRDIKGANLLVDAFGVVKLADFGMAKHLSGQDTDLSLKGSPYWMAPEVIHSVMQSDSSGDFAFAVDIWSLGCTIIEMLNGKPPWSEFEGAAAMYKVWKETPPIPETLSQAGKDFLRRCFLRNPAERPTASKLLEHPFIRNSHPIDVPAFTQAFSGMKMMDSSYMRREWSRNATDSMPLSPVSQPTKGKLSSNG